MDLALPLHVGCLRASVLCPDRRGFKDWLIRWPWLTQTRGREGHGVWGKPAAAEAVMTLHQPEARPAFSRSKLSLDPGTLAVAGCTGCPKGGVWRVTCAGT